MENQEVIKGEVVAVQQAERETLGGITEEEKRMGMFAHLSGFLAFIVPFLHLIAPVILLFMYKDKSDYVRKHCFEYLNYQLSFMIYLFISSLLMFVLIGFVLFPIVAIIAIVMNIKGILHAKNGEFYQYRFVIPFLK